MRLGDLGTERPAVRGDSRTVYDLTSLTDDIDAEFLAGDGVARVREALEHVAGYTISNDVSERAFQIEQSGGQWSKGKCCETFNPLGPYLVPAQDIPDVQALRLWSEVNGETRQDSNTRDMIFSVGYLIWHLSQYLTFDPGDIVNTGTPQGVALSGRFPYLSTGDDIRLGIDLLGEQRQNLVAAVL